MAGLVDQFRAQVAKGRVSTGFPVRTNNKTSSGYDPYGGYPSSGGGEGGYTSPALQPKPTGLGFNAGRAIGERNAAGIGNGNGFPLTTVDRVTNQRALDEIAAQYGAMYAPEMASMDDQIAMMNGSQAARSTAFEQARAAKQNQLGNQLAGADLDIKGANIQLGNIPQWLANVESARTNAYSDRERRVGDARDMQKLNFADMQAGVKDTADAQQALAVQTAAEKRKAMSAAIAGGAIGTRGPVQNEQDIWDAQNAESKKLMANSGRMMRDYDAKKLGLSQAESQANADLRDANLSLNEKSQQINERRQLLQLEAERADLSKKQMSDAINTTLADMNLQNVISQGQYLEAMANATTQQQALFRQHTEGVRVAQENNVQYGQVVMPRIASPGAWFGSASAQRRSAPAPRNAPRGGR